VASLRSGRHRPEKSCSTKPLMGAFAWKSASPQSKHPNVCAGLRERVRVMPRMPCPAARRPRPDRHARQRAAMPGSAPRRDPTGSIWTRRGRSEHETPAAGAPFRGISGGFERGGRRGCAKPGRPQPHRVLTPGGPIQHREWDASGRRDRLAEPSPDGRAVRTGPRELFGTTSFVATRRSSITAPTAPWWVSSSSRPRAA
jgi:hypothetical protein